MDEQVKPNVFFSRLQQYISCQIPGISKYLKKYDRNISRTGDAPSRFQHVISYVYPKLQSV